MGFEPAAIQGWMGRPECEWLYDRASQMGSVVEIGSWKGLSTHALLTGCPGPVFAVDHFKGNPNELNSHHREALEHDIFPIFWTNVGHYRNLVVLRMDSIEASRYFAKRSVDMVFIDGCHTPEAVKADVLAWYPVARRLLCGHDLGTVKEPLMAMNLNPRTEAGTIWSVEL